jgi:hypothetical protein
MRREKLPCTVTLSSDDSSIDLSDIGSIYSYLSSGAFPDPSISGWSADSSIDLSDLGSIYGYLSSGAFPDPSISGWSTPSAHGWDQDLDEQTDNVLVHGNEGLVRSDQVLEQVMARAVQRVADLANQAAAQAQSTPTLSPEQANSTIGLFNTAIQNLDFMLTPLTPISEGVEATPQSNPSTPMFSPPRDGEATPRRRTPRYDDQRSPLPFRNRVAPETPEMVPETPRAQRFLASARKNLTEAVNTIRGKFPGAPPRTQRRGNAPNNTLTDEGRMQIQAEQARVLQEPGPSTGGQVLVDDASYTDEYGRFRFREDDNWGDMSPSRLYRPNQTPGLRRSKRLRPN